MVVTNVRIGKGKSVVVEVQDRCAGCETDKDVDLTPTAFQQIADLGVGRIRGTFLIPFTPTYMLICRCNRPRLAIHLNGFTFCVTDGFSALDNNTPRLFYFSSCSLSAIFIRTFSPRSICNARCGLRSPAYLDMGTRSLVQVLLIGPR